MAPDIKAVIDRACRATTTTSDTVADLKQVNPSAHTFEAISRDLLFDFCDENDAVVLITRLLEIILEVVSHDLCGSDLPLAILEEAMDTQTIAQCDKLFSFLEKHRQTMTTRMGRGQTLLRLCNDLLRRLSKTKDTVFCGRILIFLSLVFPLSERSAVNLRGEYNLDNVTIYEEVPASDNDDKQETGVATEAKQNNENTTISSDSFYTTFWSLQQYFNNPAQLTTAPTILARFHANASTVIESLQGIMATMPKHEQAQKSSKDSSNRSSAEIDAVVRGHFTPKFLTSKKLLKLELADSSFRRQILIQFLIVFDYLLSLTAVSKEKLGTSASIPNRSMLNNYVLPVADAEWVSKLRDMVSNLLRIGRTGEDFYAIVENVLSRDRAWLRWKCNGCQPYDLPQIESIRADAAPAKLSSMTTARKPYQHTMGNAVLSKLWKDTASQAGYDSLQGSGMSVNLELLILIVNR